MILYDLMRIESNYSSQLYSQNRTFDSVIYLSLQITSEVFESFFLFLFHMFPHHGMDSFTTYPSKRANESFGEKTSKKA